MVRHNFYIVVIQVQILGKLSYVYKKLNIYVVNIFIVI